MDVHAMGIKKPPKGGFGRALRVKKTRKCYPTRQAEELTRLHAPGGNPGPTAK
jgi:hypothetical protein